MTEPQKNPDHPETANESNRAAQRAAAATQKNPDQKYPAAQPNAPSARPDHEAARQADQGTGPQYPSAKPGHEVYGAAGHVAQPNAPFSSARPEQETAPKLPYNSASLWPYSKDDVAWLASEIGKIDFGGTKVIVGEPWLFGLALDVFDPVCGEVIAVARPNRRDFGHPKIFLSPAQVGAAVASARIARANYDRAHGIVAPLSDAERAANEKALAAERAVAAKKAEALGV